MKIQCYSLSLCWEKDFLSRIQNSVTSSSPGEGGEYHLMDGETRLSEAERAETTCLLPGSVYRVRQVLTAWLELLGKITASQLDYVVLQGVI